MEKKKINAAIIGIFFLAVVSMYGSIFNPDIATLYGVYENQVSALNFFISGTAFFSMAMMLLCPIIEKKIGSKKLLVLGSALLGISGIMGLFSTDIIYLCVVNTIACIGYGITGTMSISVLLCIIAEEKRGFFNGIYQVAVAAAGSLFSFIGGFLTLRSWQTPLNASWLTLCVLGVAATLILAKSLPSEISSVENSEAEENVVAEKTPWKGLMLLFFGFLIVGITYQTINLFISVYVEENALGTAVFSGTLASLGTLGSAVMCFCFGFIYKKFGKKTIIFYLVTFTAFFVLMYFFPNKTVAIIASLLMGASFGGSDVYFYTICPDVAPKHMTLAVGLVGVALNVPYAVCSYLATGLMSIFGSLTASIPVCIVLIAIELVAAIFIVGKQKKEVK